MSTVAFSGSRELSSLSTFEILEAYFSEGGEGEREQKRLSRKFDASVVWQSDTSHSHILVNKGMHCRENCVS